MVSVCVVIGLLAGTASAVNIATVPVGDAGNVADTRYATPGYGSVGYSYNVGKYEVSAGQFTSFLNAVAATDTYGLYNTNMSNTSHGSGIMRSGSFTYYYDYLHTSFRSYIGVFGGYLPNEHYSVGFRVVEVPEPATIVMLALAGVGILRRRKT